ncbi:aldose 1-epimerase [Panacibacter ginsenosidivorans]|uniref:Aldose 1-epimerase n=1 Tax=Panacibacter ginsenosidivorans TaxID=1813871 RepID=A0A5B8VAF6_9BACT|nr:aldose 1-epimerase [Panacibacter ginsenosidivorans]QEC68480.1 aldose 1-epimerase [Panacibacter ginsenosidivorans]
MAFSVSIEEKGNSKVITLSDDVTGCKAELYSFGALLNKFSTTGSVNVIDGFTSVADAQQNIAKGFKSTKLSPFVCRLTKGEYKFNNSSYKIDKFYMGDSAIHGLLFDQEFAVRNTGADNEKAFSVFHYQYNKKNEGYPFSFAVEIIYTLTANNNLSLTTKITNTGNTDMPLSDGWHPYFTLGSAVDELDVQFNSKRMVEFDDKLVPTGNYLPYDHFNEMKKFGDTFLDNCFELNETGTVACTLKNSSNGLQLNIIPSAAYPYLQIYTPPHRNSIAIENLSSVPDAFNNGIGLIIAKPGKTYSFETTYQLVVN